MCIDLFLYDDSVYGDDRRQVFSSDGVGFGVIIRSIEYRSSENSTLILLTTPSLTFCL